MKLFTVTTCWLSSRNIFEGGGGAKSIGLLVCKFLLLCKFLYCVPTKFQGGKSLLKGAIASEGRPPPCRRKPACIRKIQTECEPQRKEANHDLYSVGFLSSSAEEPHLVAVAVLMRSLTSTRFPMSGGGTVTKRNSVHSFCFFNKVTS